MLYFVSHTTLLTAITHLWNNKIPFLLHFRSVGMWYNSITQTLGALLCPKGQHVSCRRESVPLADGSSGSLLAGSVHSDSIPACKVSHLLLPQARALSPEQAKSTSYPLATGKIGEYLFQPCLVWDWFSM